MIESPALVPSEPWPPAPAARPRKQTARPPRAGPQTIFRGSSAAVLPAAPGRLGMAARVAGPAAMIAVSIVVTRAMAGPIIVIVPTLVPAAARGFRMAPRIAIPARLAASVAAVLVAIFMG